MRSIAAVIALGMSWALPAVGLAQEYRDGQTLEIAIARNPFGAAESILEEGLTGNLEALGCEIAKNETFGLTREEETYRGWARNALVSRHLADLISAHRKNQYLVVGLLGSCADLPGILAGLQNMGPGREKEVYHLAAHVPHRVALVYFDAHADINTPETTLSGMYGGMDVSLAAGLFNPNNRLIAGLDPPLPPSSILLADVRDTDPREQQLIDRLQVEALSTRDIREISANVHAQMERLSRLADLIYVHVDMDVLAPEEVRGHGLTAPDGPTSRELAACIEVMFTYPKTAAIGIASTPYGPRDPEHLSRRAAIRLIEGAVQGVQRRKPPTGVEPATLILKNGAVYTMEEDQPWASAVVITGNTVTAVLEDSADADRFVGAGTRVVDLEGAFVVPGFIDGHVHFNRAGALINDANLMTVSDDAGLRREVGRAAGSLGKGEWITGGLWGAYEEWALGAEATGEKKAERWKPSHDTIDDLTSENPCFLWSFDSQLYLANGLALDQAGLADAALEGMELDGSGQPTGLLHRGSPALERIRAAVTPKSHERLLQENRAALARLRESGIVEVHDIAQPQQTARFLELQDNGELTCRVWLRPDLARAEELREKGLTMGLHPRTKQPDAWLRYGALKGYIDGIMGTHGALFFEPYDDQPDNDGHYRRHTSDSADLEIGNMEKMYELIKLGHEAGFVANVHAIGTKGVALMLDTYERLMQDLGRDLRGYRVIHAQVIRPQDFPRFEKLNVIAEVNPYHVSDDMRWMEERIGHERCKGAYAFQTLLDSGARLSFGSDWPGTSAAEYHVHPKYLIHAAVNRTTIKGTPAGGWFPEQKISVHEALKAYTINNAYAAFDEQTRGSLAPGKLADIAVCDRNLLEIDPTEIFEMNFVMTIVDGQVVFEAGS